MGEFKRNQKIDVLKGILIICVILTHFLPGSYEENYVRYFIHTFCTPLFFFVSGWLLNPQRIKQNPCLVTVRKLGRRVLVPWIAAVIVYYVFNYLRARNTSLSFVSLVKAFIIPYYHLWYIIGYLFCMVILLLLAKLLKNENRQVVALLCIGLFFAVGYIVKDACGISNAVIRFFDHTIRPYNLMYLGLGVLNKKLSFTHAQTPKAQQILQKCFVVSAVLFVVLSPIGYLKQNYWLEDVIHLLLIAIIMITINLTKDQSRPMPVLAFLGQNTLQIFLWHVLGRDIAFWITGDKNCALYYVIGGTLVLLFIVSLWGFKRIWKNSVRR